MFKLEPNSTQNIIENEAFSAVHSNLESTAQENLLVKRENLELIQNAEQQQNNNEKRTQISVEQMSSTLPNTWRITENQGHSEIKAIQNNIKKGM